MKLRDVLAQQGKPFDEREIFKKPLSVDELTALTAFRPANELFSWQSRRAKAEGWIPGQFADAELIRLMSEDPSLIKRPLVRVDGAIIVGNDPAALLAALA